MEDALAFGGACISLLNHADRVQGRLPRPARQRHRADHDRDRRPGLAADDLLAVRRLQQSRPRQGAARAASIRRPTRRPTTTRAAPSEHYVPAARGALPQARRRARRRRGHADPVRAQPAPRPRRCRSRSPPRASPGSAVERATTLHHADLAAANTRIAPEQVTPARLSGVTVGDELISAPLPPASWNVLRLKL